MRLKLLALALALLQVALAGSVNGQSYSSLTVYDAQPPSWYDPTVPVGYIREKMVWEYGRANFSSVIISPPPSSTAWSDSTEAYLLEGRSLVYTVLYPNTAFKTVWVNLTASAPLYPVAVRVDLQGPNGYNLWAAFYLFYSDGTSESVSGSVAGAGSVWVCAIDFRNASKPVTRIAIKAYYYIGAVRVFIEHPDYVYEETEIGTEWIVPVRQRFNSTTVEWWARFPKPIIITDAFPGLAWFDMAYDFTGDEYTVTLAAWYAKWTVPAARIAFYDEALNMITDEVELDAGTYYFAVAQAPHAVKLNSTLHYAPACLNGTTFAFAPSPQSVSFKIEDYGYGYVAIKAYTLDGKLVHAQQLDALRTAALNLTAYTAYSFSVWKPGEERAFGVFTVSQANYIIAVLPAYKPLQPPGSIQAWYNQSDQKFYVVVNCSAPPCSVLLRKYYPNATSQVIATWTCGEPYCRYTLLAADPLVTAEATDTEGRKLMAWAGTAFHGLLNETQRTAIRGILTKFAETWPQSWGGQTGLLIMGGVLLFLALTVPGHLFVGSLALAAYITLIGVIFETWIVVGLGLGTLLIIVAIREVLEHA